MISSDSAPALRVGLNGFGRIGRSVFRIAHRARAFHVAAVNDLDPDVANLAYLLRYDSTYGRFGGNIAIDEEGMSVDGLRTRFFSHCDAADVPWESETLDVLIDATGSRANVAAAARLVAEGRVGRAVVTWSPPSGVDQTIVFGVNEETFDASRHRVVSASICDAIASAPVLKAVDDAFGIESGSVTTLHPWLSYQNLVDGPVSSVASPGHFWKDYSLGRASVMSLIPKDTTLVGALAQVLPDLSQRIDAMSFRVPTGIVAASDMTLILARHTTAEDLNRMLLERAGAIRTLGFQTDHLVSIDFAGIEESCVIDGRWTRVSGGRLAKIVIWYDNECGYSWRVVDLVRLVGNARPLGAPAA